MDRWIYKWIDGYINGLFDKQRAGQMNGWLNKQRAGQMNGWLNKQKDRQMDGQRDIGIDGYMN